MVFIHVKIHSKRQEIIRIIVTLVSEMFAQGKKQLETRVIFKTTSQETLTCLHEIKQRFFFLIQNGRLKISLFSKNDQFLKIFCENFMDWSFICRID